MPLYEYSCRECGFEFEKMMSFSQSNKLPECPHCKSVDTRKQISTFATKGSSTASSGSCSPTSRFT